MDYNKKQEKRITFLLGAGAEGRRNYDMPTGADFLCDSLLISETKKDVRNTLKEAFKNSSNDKYRYFDKPLFQSQRLIDNCIKNIYRDSQINLSDSIKSEIEKHYNNIGDNKYNNYNNRIKIEEKLLEKLIQNCDNNTKINIFEKIIFELKNKNINIYMDTLNIGGTLDGYFHTINNPQLLGPYKFSRVVNYYWAAYFSVVRKIVENYAKNEMEEYCNDSKINYDKIIGDIKEFTKKLYSISTHSSKNSKTYYSLINKEFLSDNYTIHTATTNYYKFCSDVFSNTAYLNGKLCWFEFPETLDVVDLSCEEFDISKKIFFPFIFAQSYLKPIVNPLQVKEFAKFNDFLSDSDYLIILGYGINEDDNHINSFIHTFAKKEGKRIVYVTNNNEEDISKKLHISENKIIKCIVDYSDNKKTIKKIKELIEKDFHTERA